MESARNVCQCGYMDWATPYGVTGTYQCPRCGGGIIISGPLAVAAVVRRSWFGRLLRSWVGLIFFGFVIVGVLVGGVLFVREMSKKMLKPPANAHFDEIYVEDARPYLTVYLHLSPSDSDTESKMVGYYVAKYDDPLYLDMYLYNPSVVVNADDVRGGNRDAIDFTQRRAFISYHWDKLEKTASAIVPGPVAVEKFSCNGKEKGNDELVTWKAVARNTGDQPQYVRVQVAAYDKDYHYLKGTDPVEVQIAAGGAKDVTGELVLSKELYKRAVHYEVIAYAVRY